MASTTTMVYVHIQKKFKKILPLALPFLSWCNSFVFPSNLGIKFGASTYASIFPLEPPGLENVVTRWLRVPEHHIKGKIKTPFNVYINAKWKHANARWQRASIINLQEIHESLIKDFVANVGGRSKRFAISWDTRRKRETFNEAKQSVLVAGFLILKYSQVSPTIKCLWAGCCLASTALLCIDLACAYLFYRSKGRALLSSPKNYCWIISEAHIMNKPLLEIKSATGFVHQLLFLFWLNFRRGCWAGNLTTGFIKMRFVMSVELRTSSCGWKGGTAHEKMRK